MKHTLITIVVLVIWAVATSYFITLFSNSYDEDMAIIGKEIILKNDTLLIIGCSPFLNTCTLDNGVEVGMEFAKQNLITE